MPNARWRMILLSIAAVCIIAAALYFGLRGPMRQKAGLRRAQGAYAAFLALQVGSTTQSEAESRLRAYMTPDDSRAYRGEAGFENRSVTLRVAPANYPERRRQLWLFLRFQQGRLISRSAALLVDDCGLTASQHWGHEEGSPAEHHNEAAYTSARHVVIDDEQAPADVVKKDFDLPIERLGMSEYCRASEQIAAQ